MSAINIRVPESMHDTLRDIAKRENISINQFVMLAVAEKIAALQTAEFFALRAAQANRAAFEAVLDTIPAIEPEEQDQI